MESQISWAEIGLFRESLSELDKVGRDISDKKVSMLGVEMVVLVEYKV